MESPLAIFRRFLRFGLLAFGGPVAQIAMIRRELVEVERWLPGDRFNRLLAVYQALPGPEAHELCVHIGRMRGGRLGGLAAGLGFMAPGFAIVLALAILYTQVDLTGPWLSTALLGAQVAVVALVAVATARIGRHVVTDRPLAVIALASFGATMVGASFWLVLPAAGLAYVLARGGRLLAPAAVGLVALALALLAESSGPDAPSAAAGPATAAALFVAGLKGGLLTFGGAYTAIPFVRDDTVGRGWLGDGQFLDALALSGMAPAPLVMFATFVGYVAGGIGGALAITAGMFLPAFAFGLLLYDRLEAVIDDDRLHRLLDGIAAGVVGIIAATALDLATGLGARIPDRWAGGALFLAAIAALLLARSRWTPLWLVPAAGLAGALLLR